MKERNRREVWPFEGLYLSQARLAEANAALTAENNSLTVANDRLKAENVELSAAVAARVKAGPADSALVQELQQKMFNLQGRKRSSRSLCHELGLIDQGEF